MTITNDEIVKWHNDACLNVNGGDCLIEAEKVLAICAELEASRRTIAELEAGREAQRDLISRYRDKVVEKRVRIATLTSDLAKAREKIERLKKIDHDHADVLNATQNSAMQQISELEEKITEMWSLHHLGDEENRRLERRLSELEAENARLKERLSHWPSASWS